MPPGQRTTAVFSIEGQAAEEKIGNFGFYEGTYAAVLQFIQSKGLGRENIIGSIGYNSTSTNYYLFYWKP